MVSSLLLLCACLVGLVSSRIPPLYKPQDAHVHFERFIEQYNKYYETEHERQMRFEIFKESLEEINRFNEDSEHAFFGNHIDNFIFLTYPILRR